MDFDQSTSKELEKKTGRLHPNQREPSKTNSIVSYKACEHPLNVKVGTILDILQLPKSASLLKMSY